MNLGDLLCFFAPQRIPKWQRNQTAFNPRGGAIGSRFSLGGIAIVSLRVLAKTLTRWRVGLWRSIESGNGKSLDFGQIGIFTTP